MKEQFRPILEKQISDLATREIPINKLIQQQFEMRFEDMMQTCMLYRDEITQVVAMSVVPENI